MKRITDKSVESGKGKLLCMVTVAGMCMHLWSSGTFMLIRTHLRTSIIIIDLNKIKQNTEADA